MNPYVVLPHSMPRVGQLVELHFVTRHGGNAPAAPCWMLVSFNPAPFTPVDFSPFGMPGCWLLARPDYVISVPTTAGGLMVREGGDVWFRWTPPAGQAGTHLWAQLLVAAPGETTSGFLVSPAVELIVGGS